jgi:hypothetical protein
VTVQEVLDAILGQLGVLVLLLVILWAGWKGYWVFGWYARELRDRNEKLERRLDRAVGAAESGTGLATRATRLAEERQTGTNGE